MKPWLPALAVAALLTPFALGGEGESRPPCCCVKDGKTPSCPCCAAPEDERQAYQELMEIVRTTDSPDTFMAAVSALLGAEGPAEKRFARLAVPTVIRNAERLGLLKGIATADHLTPVQEELLDYLDGGATPGEKAEQERMPSPPPTGLPAPAVSPTL